MIDKLLQQPQWLQQLFLLLLTLILAIMLYYLFVASKMQQWQTQQIESQQRHHHIRQLKDQISHFPPYHTVVNLNANDIKSNPHNELLSLIHSSNSQLYSFNQTHGLHWQIHCQGEYQQLMQLLQQVSQATLPLLIEKIEISVDERTAQLNLMLAIALKEYPNE